MAGDLTVQEMLIADQRGQSFIEHSIGRSSSSDGVAHRSFRLTAFLRALADIFLCSVVILGSALAVAAIALIAPVLIALFALLGLGWRSQKFHCQSAKAA